MYVLNMSRSTLSVDPDIPPPFADDKPVVGGGEASPQCFFSSTAKQPLSAADAADVLPLAVGVPGPVPAADAFAEADNDSLRLCLLSESILLLQVAQFEYGNVADFTAHCTHVLFCD